MNKVLEITKLAMEINELGKHQVFVDISPHVKDVTVSIYEGKWEREKNAAYRNYFYYDNLNNYEEIRNKLLKLKEKDLSGQASVKVKENYNQDNCITNKNKVKQVRLISQEDYFDLIVFLSNVELAIINGDIDLALSGIKSQKKTLKENIGEI